MASVNFVDGVTKIEAQWLNAVDTLLYDVFGGAQTGAEIRTAISAMSSAGDIVTGDYDITGTMDISGNTTVGGNLDVTGEITFGSLDMTAAEVDYDNAGTTVMATNVQDAITEMWSEKLDNHTDTFDGVLTVNGGIVVDGYIQADEINVAASGVTYDNTVSGLDADNVQEAIDAVVAEAGVFSFNGRIGVVIPETGDYTKDMVGLANVDNTSDLNKPISTATQSALDGKTGLAEAETVTGAWDFTTAPTINSDTVWTSGNHDSTGNPHDQYTLETGGNIDGYSPHIPDGGAIEGPTWGSDWPTVQASGAMEVGRYIDFHSVTDDTEDYTVRLDGGALGSNTLNVSGHITADNSITANGNIVSSTGTFTGDGRKTTVGTGHVPISVATTLVADHQGRLLITTSDVVLTVPPSTFPSGAVVFWTSAISNTTAMAAGAGVNLRVPTGKIAAPRTTWSTIGIIQYGLNSWVVFGDLADA